MVPFRNGETYFFRDLGQFDLLRLRLLPELIERCGARKRLRLLSAGCASGEEAYSLAMVLDMLLPNQGGWDITILGVDLDRASLEKARRGIYGHWSFRVLPPTLLQRYFRREGTEWVLDEGIRRKVSFRTLDLIADPLGELDLQSMDLILCRNVFIYFDAATVESVADKLAACLNEGGFLMAGHTELIGHRLGQMQSRLFPEGVVYQRMPAPVCPQTRVIPLPPAPMRAVPPPAMPQHEDALASAQAAADRGDYEGAEEACRQILAANPLASAPYFLLAQLAQIKGEFQQAESLLDKTLYLDPLSVAANLELAALCERADKLGRARILRRTALDIVSKLPADTVIEPYEAKAAEVAKWLAP